MKLVGFLEAYRFFFMIVGFLDDCRLFEACRLFKLVGFLDVCGFLDALRLSWSFFYACRFFCGL